MSNSVYYWQARSWVATELKVDPDTSVNLFETTIRVLGGLLAAFHLSNGDKVMLYKAASLALRLLPAFNSESGDPSPSLPVPCPTLNCWGFTSAALRWKIQSTFKHMQAINVAAQALQAFYLYSRRSKCSVGIPMHCSAIMGDSHGVPVDSETEQKQAYPR